MSQPARARGPGQAAHHLCVGAVWPLSDPRLWPLVRRAINERMDNVVGDMKRGVAEREYLLACGEIRGLQFALDTALNVIKDINSGQDMEDV